MFGVSGSSVLIRSTLLLGGGKYGTWEECTLDFQSAEDREQPM